MSGRPRKLGVDRHPNGSVVRPGSDVSPAAVRRLRDAAFNRMESPVYGTMIGQLFIQGTISPGQFAAAQEYATTTSNRFTIGGERSPWPRSPLIEFASKETGDSRAENTAKVRQAKRRAVNMDSAILIYAGTNAVRTLENAVWHDEFPVGTRGMMDLKKALSAVYQHFGMYDRGGDSAPEGPAPLYVTEAA